MTKTARITTSGAVALVAVWIAQQAGLEMPAEIGSAFGVLFVGAGEALRSLFADDPHKP